MEQKSPLSWGRGLKQLPQNGGNQNGGGRPSRGGVD